MDHYNCVSLLCSIFSRYIKLLFYDTNRCYINMNPHIYPPVAFGNEHESYYNILTNVTHLRKPRQYGNKVKSKVKSLSLHPGSELCCADFDKYPSWSFGLYSLYISIHISNLNSLGSIQPLTRNFGATANKYTLTIKITNVSTIEIEFNTTLTVLHNQVQNRLHSPWISISLLNRALSIWL